MKYYALFFSFLWILFALNGQSQIKYVQNFENGFGDMLLLDQDGKQPAEPVETYGSNWTIKTYEDGDQWAVSNSYFAEPAKANDWMITPVIENISENTILKWQAFSYNSLFPDSYEVRISPTGGSNPADFTKILTTINEESNVEVQRGLILKEFAGNSIRIAFRNISFDKYLLYLDDIIIEEVSSVDVSIQKLNFEKYPLINTPISLSFEIKNAGVQTINEINFQLRVGTKVIEFTEEELNLDFLNSVIVQTGEIVNHDAAEKLLVELKILSINGINVGLEPNTFGIHFLQNKWKRSILTEALTSTSCRWCPKGIYYIAEIEKSSDDDVIAVSVHHDDIMTNSEYEDGMSNIFEFDDYPNIVINRSQLIDPGNLSTVINNFKNKSFAPVKISLSASRDKRRFFINTGLEFNTSFVEENLKVIVTLVEDNVMGEGFIYNQANIYAGGGLGPLGGFENLPDPIPYTDIQYHNVARQLLFGFKGQNDLLKANYSLGETGSFEFYIDIDTSYTLENTSLVIMLSDESGEVINAEKLNLNTVSINELEDFDELIIFPNPVYDRVEFISNENLKDATISIIDTEGQIKQNFKLTHNSIDLSDIPAGLYYLRVKTDVKSYFCKLIKL